VKVLEYGEPGWSLYVLDENAVYTGADAIVWLTNGEQAEWRIEMFVNRVDGDGKIHELALCSVSLAEVLADGISDRQGYEHPAEEKALRDLVGAKDDGDEMVALRSILQSAIDYIDAVSAEQGKSA
jgi:hypothetical protein